MRKSRGSYFQVMKQFELISREDMQQVKLVLESALTSHRISRWSLDFVLFLSPLLCVASSRSISSFCLSLSIFLSRFARLICVRFSSTNKGEGDGRARPSGDTVQIIIWLTQIRDPVSARAFHFHLHAQLTRFTLPSLFRCSQP